jgi:hypothetical protein
MYLHVLGMVRIDTSKKLTAGSQGGQQIDEWIFEGERTVYAFKHWMNIARHVGWMDGWMDGWVGGWMDGWMDG